MKKKLNKKAYLLLEVLLAVSILSVGLTVVIRSFLSSFRAVVFVADYSKAVFLADNKMSDLLQEGSIAEALSEEGAFPAPDDKFQYRLETVNVPQGDKKGFFNLVKLNVFWPSGKKARNILLTTYLPSATNENRR